MQSINLGGIYEWRLWDTRHQSTRIIIFSEEIWKQHRMVRSINQPNRRYEKQHIQNCLIKEKEVKELKKCANKNGHNEELKIYI